MKGRRGQRAGVGEEEIAPDGWLKARDVSARAIVLFRLPTTTSGGGDGGTSRDGDAAGGPAGATNW